jgi:cell pole-organizing protein PopZ
MATDDKAIMSIAGHVSRAMLPRYSHVRMEAKRRALDEIAAAKLRPIKSGGKRPRGSRPLRIH